MPSALRVTEPYEGWVISESENAVPGHSSMITAVAPSPAAPPPASGMPAPMEKSKPPPCCSVSVTVTIDGKPSASWMVTVKLSVPTKSGYIIKSE